MLSNTAKHKIRIFVKTYLYLKGEATSRELTFAINDLDLGIRDGVTATEMSKYLKSLTYKGNKQFLDCLSFRKKGNITIYYLKEGKE